MSQLRPRREKSSRIYERDIGAEEYGLQGKSFIHIDVAPNSLTDGRQIHPSGPQRVLETLTEASRNRDFISSLTSIACSWIVSRPQEKGFTYTQELPVKWWIFTRKVKARMTMHTWS